jgi:putative chitinase
VALTASQISQIMPRCLKATVWEGSLTKAMARYEINTPHRIAAFLAQLAVESGELNRMEENLNYSAKGLMKTWPKRFPTVQKAEEYAKKPEKIANHVYADRLGNGDEASGDGWRYRGRGLIQLTGRGNYRSTGKAIGVDLEANPDRAVDPDIAAMVAAQFWQSRGLNELADDRSDDDDNAEFVKICTLVNGGKTGLKERQTFWSTAKKILVGA